MNIHRRHRPGTEVHTLIGPYVLDAVTDLERVAVERHLRDCATCADEVTELRAAAARLGAVTTTPAPTDLRARVLAEVGRTRQQGPDTGHGGRPSPPRWARWAAGAAAGVAILAGTVAVTSAVEGHRVDDQRHAASTARADRDRLTAILAAPDATIVRGKPPGGTAQLVMSADRDQAVALLTDLPSLAAGRTYQLWLIDGATPRNVGVLDDGAHSARTFLTGIRAADGFAISTEPTGGSTKPSNVWAQLSLPT